MNLARRINRNASRLLIVALLGALAMTSGCVYRLNIQQGNLLKTSDVDQVVPGMTRSQVRYLLGTPMVADPFSPQRWDYVYSFRRGRDRTVDRAHFVVHFEGDKVSRVERVEIPLDLTQPSQPKKHFWQIWSRTPEAAAPAQPPTAPAPTEAPGTPTSPPPPPSS